MTSSLTGTSLLDYFSKLSEASVKLVSGDIQIPIQQISSPEKQAKNSLVFVNSTKTLNLALKGSCSAICLSDKIIPAPEELSKTNKTIFSSPNPYLAMALTLQKFFAKDFRLSQPPNAPLIHPTAIIADSAQISDNVFIGAYSVIGEHVVIGSNTTIKEHCVVENQASIGKNCKLFPFVFIGHHCILNDNCSIQSQTTIGSEGFGYAHSQNKPHHIPHMGKVVLEENVEIGASCTIDRGTFEDTKIGKNSIIDNKIHIAHNVEIGERAILTGGFMVAGSTKIGSHFIAGARSGAIGHLNITDNVTLSHSTAVDRDIKKPGTYGGAPAVPIEIYKRNHIAGTKLADMKKNVSTLMKKFFSEG